MKSLWLLAIALAVVVGSAAGQSAWGSVQVTYVSHDELDKSLEHGGFGVAAAVGATRGKWGVELEGFRASLNPYTSTGAPFRLTQIDFRATYNLQPAIAVVVGASRRWSGPRFAAPDVGFVRVGLLTQAGLTRQARIWARGAYLIAPRFNGGGSAGLAIEIGLGTWIGTADGRYGLRGEYGFQRIDRKVNGAAVPIQMVVAKAGVQLAF